MDETSTVKLLASALASLQSNDMAAQQELFDPKASFFLGQNAYRVDDLAAFQQASRSFFDAGGRFVHIDIRQPRSVELKDGALVSFHYAQRLEIGQVSTGTTGKGTAVIVGGRVLHLHMSENQGSSLLPAPNASVEAIFSAVNRVGCSSEDVLKRAMWGTE